MNAGGGLAPAVSAPLRYFAHSAYLSAKGYVMRQMRAGREFRRVLEELEESQWYPRDRLRDLQDAKLRAIVAHAYENVPYYRRLFDRHGLKPADVQCAEDLGKIPTISKDTIRRAPDDFVARNHPRRLQKSGWTTGSTGAPLRVYRTLASIVFDKATLVRQRRRAGVDMYERNVAMWGTIWGNVLVPREVSSPPYWRFNAADNQMLFSYYHLSDATLPIFVQKLRDFRPAFIEGFPSTFLTFARFLKQRGEVVHVRAAFTSSEPLYSAHRREIEEAFQTRIFDYYGHAERAVTAADCEHSRMHVNPEYGVLEILQGEKPAPPGECGEIVGTGLTNYAMPLIRYRTGDVSRLVDEACACRRESPLLGPVEGRVADMIRMPDGRVMPGDGIMEAFYGLRNIKESQVVQLAIDRIVVRLVKDDADAPLDTRRLRSNLERCLGDEVKLEFEILDSLADGSGLKRRWVESRLAVRDV